MKKIEEDNPTSRSSNKEKLALLEAALYVSGRPLGLKTLGSIVGIRSKSKILRLARTLVKNYESWNTPLEIRELRGYRFVFQLKPEYTKRVRRLSFQPMLTEAELKTLTYIAYHQPVLQTRIVRARGSHAYRHMKRLEKLKFIKRRENGRTKIVRTTKGFADYLGLSRNLSAMKRQLKKMLKRKKKVRY